MQPYGNNDNNPPGLAPPPLDLGTFMSHNPSNTPLSSFGSLFSPAPGTMSADTFRQISHGGPGRLDSHMNTALPGQGSGNGGFDLPPAAGAPLGPPPPSLSFPIPYPNLGDSSRSTRMPSSAQPIDVGQEQKELTLAGLAEIFLKAASAAALTGERSVHAVIGTSRSSV